MAFIDLPVIGGGGSGTVSSVGLTLPSSVFTVTGSPITTSGTIDGALNSQTANTFFAAPNGSSGTPVFRTIVASDIPPLPYVSGSSTLAGRVAYWTGTSTIDDAVGFFWDAANGRLGLGTSTPSGTLDVRTTVDAGASTGDLIVNTSTTFPSVTVGRQSTTVNSSAKFQVIDRNGTGLFVVNSTAAAAGSSLNYFTQGALLGLATSAPTHSLTLGSASTGEAFYGTTDQTTNFERMRQTWDGTRFLLGVENGGTGIVRTLRLATRNQATYIDLNNSISSSPALMDFNTSAVVWTPFAATSIYRFYTSIGGSSLIEPVLTVTPTVTQTGTGGYTGIMVSPFESTVGTGNKLLLDLGTNSAAGGAIATHTSKFSVDRLGNMITASTATSGHTYYNTVDQVTNYEEVSLGFQTNRYLIESTTAGTGSVRPILISVGTTRLFETSFTPSVGKGIFDFTNTLSATGGPTLSINGSFTATAPAQSALQITPTVNQSSAATFKGVYVSPFLSTVGASTLLMDLGTNTAAANAGTHTSKFSIASHGRTSINTSSQSMAYNAAGMVLAVTPGTINDVTSTGTVATVSALGISIPTIAASAATTYTNAATLFIAGAPTASTNATFSNTSAIYVQAGMSLFAGGISTSGPSTVTTTNFSAVGLTGVSTTSGALAQFGGSTSINYRIISAPGTTATLGVGTSYATQILGSAPVATAASGTHNILANLVVNGLGTITANGATVTNTAAVYVNGAATGGTNNYAVMVGAGNSYHDGKISYGATNTAAGTTGAQTINKATGTVNFAAGATSLVVTNNLVTATSIVFAVIRTNDATAIIKNVVPAAGSFTINLNAAATAETSVGFKVVN